MSNDLCRLCSNLSPRGLLSLERTGEVLKKINSCLNFQVVPEKNLPQYVCKDCYTRVLEFNVFQSNCLSTEISRRNDVGLPSPVMTKDDALAPHFRSALNNQGMKLLRNNIVELNDKIAMLTQERELLKSNIETLQQENEMLKTTVISHSKSLPDITKNMMSLLSRMEQQFVLSNSRLVNGSQDEAEEVQEQMETNYDHLIDWNQTSQEGQQDEQDRKQINQITPQISFIATPRAPTETVTIPGIPPGAHLAYVCDSMIDHVTEVEINCDTNEESVDNLEDTDRPADSPTYEEEREPIVDSEVNDLLVQLCEQQEKMAFKQEVKPLCKPSSPLRKSYDYELVVSRRSARQPVRKIL